MTVNKCDAIHNPDHHPFLFAASQQKAASQLGFVGVTMKDEPKKYKPS
jgi:hypothetical protein